jgi:hypothetical protein
VESAGGPWFILSAKYGLVDPGQVIEPYEMTLNRMGRRERQAWAERVLHDTFFPTCAAAREWSYWLAIDPPGRGSERGLIERHSIGLLSNFNCDPLDPPSQNWLGRFCNRKRVRKSGLWNNEHVDGSYDATFLNLLERCAFGGVTGGDGS